MRICHITARLPPDPAACAMLPAQLGRWSRETGHEVGFIAHPPDAAPDRDAAAASLPGPVIWIERREASAAMRALRIDSLRTAADVWSRTRESIATCDLVHVHGSGLLPEMGAFLATRLGRPYVLTLYGEEIWEYRPGRGGLDLFARAYQRAAHVTFYSHGLHTRAVELGLARHRAGVVYPPVAEAFVHHDERAQGDARAALGYRQRHVIANVKRLHPLSGQRVLIEALGEVVRTHPDTRLVICGTGPLLEELRGVARANGVEPHVTFTGRLDTPAVARIAAAADLFVLPSLLEACPTPALEALASGTPIVSGDNPGGLELREIFGYDVQIVPGGNALALARAIVGALDQKRRVRDATRRIIEQDFRPAAVHRQFREIYAAAADGRREAVS